MTPEVGATGFWPTMEEIYPLAEENLQANKLLAHVAGIYPTIKEISYVVEDSANRKTTIAVQLKNRGLSASKEFFLLASTDDGVVTPSAAVPKLASFQESTLLFDFIPGIGTSKGVVTFMVALSETFSLLDSIDIYTERRTVLLSDSADTTSRWSTGAGWNVTGDLQLNSKVFTDSPNGKYAANIDNALTLLSPVDLSSYQYAELKFKTKWSIEPVWDFGVIEISTNGGSAWKPVKTRYSRKGSARLGSKQPAGSFGYDAFSPSSGWIEQTADISEFTGEQITIRFRLSSDAGEERDGWYLDDITVVGYSYSPLSVATEEIPQTFVLSQNYPNPFNPVTRINYGIPRSGFVTLYVYDVLGRKVAELVHGVKEAGNHTALFDATRLSSGVYFYRLTTGTVSTVRTMTLLK